MPGISPYAVVIGLGFPRAPQIEWYRLVTKYNHFFVFILRLFEFYRLIFLYSQK